MRTYPRGILPWNIRKYPFSSHFANHDNSGYQLAGDFDLVTGAKWEEALKEASSCGGGAAIVGTFAYCAVAALLPAHEDRAQESITETAHRLIHNR